MKSRPDIVVVGAGVFGVSAATELRARGAVVELIDPGPLPHPEASSTDISKAVRMDYGADAFYTELAEQSISSWREYNFRWEEELYHEDGFLLMIPDAMGPGSFEGDGFRLLRGRGHRLERMDATRLRRRFPAWDTERYVDGYLNPAAGWVESAKVMVRLLEQARAAGVILREGTKFAGLLGQGSRVSGVAVENGSASSADFVVLATGAWTPKLLPELQSVMWASGQPVLHFRPRERDLFEPQRFPVWGADISRTGWYGFPLTANGVLKVGNHGPGTRADPSGPRKVDPAVEVSCRDFFRGTFPALVDAPLVESRVCFYCDTWDGNFWIDHHPEREGLVVAAGGCGHGFKFAPVLGRIIADVLERKPNPCAARFAWRRRGDRSSEQARKA